MGTESLEWIAAAVAGAVMGLFFFGGLWTTVQGLKASSRPALLMLGSLLLRFGVVLIGFYGLVRYGDWSHALAAMIGLLGMRWFLVRRFGPVTKAVSAREREQTE